MPYPESIVVSGSSMAPTVDLGDRVALREQRCFRSGDVVLLATDDRSTHVLHRVVLRVPFSPWFAHAGDAAISLKGVGLARASRVIAVADLPRRRARAFHYAGAIAAAVERARARLRRWAARGQSSVPPAEAR